LYANGSCVLIVVQVSVFRLPFTRSSRLLLPLFKRILLNGLSSSSLPMTMHLNRLVDSDAEAVGTVLFNRHAHFLHFVPSLDHCKIVETWYIVMVAWLPCKLQEPEEATSSA
jgi:hypothetical protein